LYGWVSSSPCPPQAYKFHLPHIYAPTSYPPYMLEVFCKIDCWWLLRVTLWNGYFNGINTTFP
jgi:hypothetical protein